MAVNSYGIVTQGRKPLNTAEVLATLTESSITSRDEGGEVTFSDFALDCLGNKGSTLRTHVTAWAESLGLTILGMGKTPDGLFRVAYVTPAPKRSRTPKA